MFRYLIALVVAAAFMGAAPMETRAQSATSTVGSAQDLAANLRSGGGARTIALRAGNYDEVTIENATPDGVVRIVPADEASPPVIRRLVVRGSRNLSFEKIRFSPRAGDDERGLLARVSNSSNITFSRTSFTADQFPIVNRLTALDIEESQSVSVSDSRFSGLWAGIAVRRAQRLRVEHNLFERLGVAAAQLREISDSIIDSNQFRGFAPGGPSLATFIQVSTRDTEQPTRDVRVVNNVLIQDTTTQANGIVFANEARLRFDRVAILDNIVVNGSGAGITITDGAEVALERNIVLETLDSTITTGISVQRVTGGLIQNNHTVSYSFWSSENLVQRRNTMTTRREIRSRRVQLQRIDDGLAGAGSGRIHADRFVTAAHRAAGPRP